MKKTWIAYPYVIWAVVFTIIPMFLMLYYGFTTEAEDGSIMFSLENYKDFFTNRIYLSVLGRSLWFSAVATVICLVLGYPVAYILARSDFKNKGFLMSMLVVPMWMNLLLRTYAWLVLLDNNGLVNMVLEFFGVNPVQFLYNDGAIIFGMVYNFLPFMILPIHSVLVKMDKHAIEAAQDLGADKKQVFKRIILPLSVPGIVSGITMVFMPAVTTFAISNILSGRKTSLMGNLIENQFVLQDNWHRGAAISIVLIVIILLSMVFTSKYEKDDERGGLF